MLCPQCQTLLIENEHCSVEVNHCPQCNGQWLKSGNLAKLIEQVQLAEKDDDTLLTRLVKEEVIVEKVIVTSDKKNRKHPHFLSGALDIYD